MISPSYPDTVKLANTSRHYALPTCEQCAPAKVTAEQKPHLKITKEASPTTYSKVGDVISYTIVATNDGNVTLSNVSVKDEPALEGFSCSPTIPTTLAPGKSITCTGSHTITQADLDAGKLADTACVSATGAPEQCAPAEVTAEQKPHLKITKEATPTTYKIGRASCRDTVETTK